MRQLRWGRKAGFPYTKVFVLGIILSGLGSACVVVAVVGIVNLAWGYYVSTGMWGGVTVTASGLAAMYAARAQSSFSARLYFFLSVLTCLVSFAMLVLSAGGLTYSSNFYHPIRFDSSRHQVTLFLHGSVLGIGVLSLACNVLSVIVCCKFIIREKERTEESFKLRRHRHRLSDPAALHRSSCLRSGSDAVRYSASCRTPLFGLERSHKLSSQTKKSDSTNLKITRERSSYRRDSDRSKGSTRSHHRQSSSVSQQSRHSAPMEAEFTTILLRDTDPSSLSSHIEMTSSHSTTDNARDSQADTLTDMSLQLVFDPDEEPLPPYEEARPFVLESGDGNPPDSGTREGGSNLAVSSCLPLNIPVTLIGACQTQALLRQPPPMSPSHAERVQQRRRHHGDELSSAMERASLDPMNPAALSVNDRDKNCIVMQTTTDQRTRVAVSPDHQPVPQVETPSGTFRPEDGSASPEICALTGERMTPVAAMQPDTVSANTSVFMSCVAQHNPSPDSSDTSIPSDRIAAAQNAAFPNADSGHTPATGSSSSSALPPGIHSPSSAFRPVGKQVVPLAQASPSRCIPGHNYFSPICSSGSAHHTVYSPVASPSAANRFVSPSSPHHVANSASSSESLPQGSPSQPLSWKKMPLPQSHNHSNRTSSVPFKEVTSKTIPGPSQPLRRGKGEKPHSLPRQSSRHADRRVAAGHLKKLDSRAKVQCAPVPAETNASGNPGQLEQSAAKPVEEDKGVRSAFVCKQPGGLAKVSTKDSFFTAKSSLMVASGAPSMTVDNHSAAEVNQPTVPCPLSKQRSSHPIGAKGQTAVGSNHTGGAGDNCTSAGSHYILSNNQFTPIGGLPAPVCSQPAATIKKTSFGSPSRAARTQLVGGDPSHRSAGCQATDDGGIASSMDRTHRWVMGTLPSGTRFQGTTKNTALIHSATRNSKFNQGPLRNSGHIQGSPRGSGHSQAAPRNSSADRSAAVSQDIIRTVPLTQAAAKNPGIAAHASPGSKLSPLAPTTTHISGKAHGMWVQPSKGGAAGAATQAPVSVSSQPVKQQASSSSEAQMGASGVGLPRPVALRQPDAQPRLPPPPPQPSHQQHQSHRQRPQPQHRQQQQQPQQQEPEQDQQQGKPLFSVLL